MKPLLSVILIHDRSVSALTDCLRSLHVATSATVEVILVDRSNASAAERIFQAERFGGAYIPQATDLGLARSVNMGVERSEGDYIVVATADMVFQQQSLDRLLAFAQQHRRSIVGPRLVDERDQALTTIVPQMNRRMVWGAETVSRIPWPRWMQPALGWLVPSFRYAWICRTARSPVPVPALTGECWVTKRTVWDELGPWNSQLRYFGAAAEWFERVHQSGATTWYLPSAQVYHLPTVHVEHEAVTDRRLSERRWYAQRKGWVAVGLLAIAVWFERRRRS